MSIKINCFKLVNYNIKWFITAVLWSKLFAFFNSDCQVDQFLPAEQFSALSPAKTLPKKKSEFFVSIFLNLK